MAAVPLLRRAALVLFVLEAAVAQDPRAERVRAHLAAREIASAVELTEAALRDTPDSLDWLTLKVRVLLASGDLAAAAASLDELERSATAARAGLIDALAQARQRRDVAAAAPTPADAQRPSRAANPELHASGGDAPAPGPAAPTPPVLGAVDQLLAARASDDPLARDRAERSLPGAIERAAGEVARRIAAGDEDGALSIAEPLLKKVDVVPSASVGGLVVLAGSADANIAELAEQKLVEAVRELVVEVVALLMAGDTERGERATAVIERGLTALGRLHRDRDAVRSLDPFVRAGAPTVASQGLRLLGGALERWAARLDAAFSPPAETEDFFASASQYGAELQTETAGHAGMRFLAASRHEAIAAKARAVLVAWGEVLAVRGRQAERDGNMADAARDLERAHACDPSRVTDGLDAARLHGASEQPGHAARLHRLLLDCGVDEVVRASRDALATMWLSGRANLDRLPPSPPAKASVAEGRAWLDAVARLLPVLEGPDLAALRDLTEARLFKAAGERLQKFTDAMRAGPPVWGEPEPVPATAVLAAAARPEVGVDFTLARGGMTCRWVPPTADQPGFWRAAVAVDSARWRDVVAQANLALPDDPGGYVCASWSNAALFCSVLTRDEQAAGRLPADHVYTLPSTGELARMRDAAGRIPGARSAWLWTRDVDPWNHDASTDLPSRVRVHVEHPDRTRSDWCWAPRPGVGFLVVLTRRS